MNALERCKELLEKITPGDWQFVQGFPYPSSLRVIREKSNNDIVLKNGRYQIADAQFIAESPTLMRSLVERVEELEKENLRLK